MHGVVLLFAVVEVFGVFVDLIAAKHALKQKERVEIWVFPVGRVVEDAD